MKKAIALLILVLTATALAACGGDGKTSAETSTEKSGPATFKEEHPGSALYGSPPLEFEADPGGDLAYTADEVTAKEGNVTIEFTNPQPIPHNIAIEAVGDGRVETETVTEGFTASTISLYSDEKYIFYCTVPGHRKAGMEGIVKVKKRK